MPETITTSYYPSRHKNDEGRIDGWSVVKNVQEWVNASPRDLMREPIGPACFTYEHAHRICSRLNNEPKTPYRHEPEQCIEVLQSGRWFMKRASNARKLVMQWARASRHLSFHELRDLEFLLDRRRYVTRRVTGRAR